MTFGCKESEYLIQDGRHSVHFEHIGSLLIFLNNCFSPNLNLFCYIYSLNNLDIFFKFKVKDQF